MAKSKWKEIYQVLKQRIVTGEYQAGQEFPTNFELMKEFEVHAATIQNSVNALIRDGYIASAGSTNIRRTVCDLNTFPVRRGGFRDEHSKGTKEVLQMEIIQDASLLPENESQLKPPVLYYYTRQWKDDQVVAISESFIPQCIPLDKLKEELQAPEARLYETMKSFGQKPNVCVETLVAATPTSDEQEKLQLDEPTPVVRITRKVYDHKNKLLEYCKLTDRADCYQYTYRVPFE
ncbi:GntR family transcriptional regulator [Hazenella coriacea]|uniref:GntR family transcriptional regulator n=1 Tax=Hazenella coriacea TaxID=1179467 RepID=A0A4R3L3I9_9BACL|nr:GntR family transcriptional regulator [Hazenella coriacea]TCS93488.1 GntR family transcriptional regulator [Hazenella coriacea]